jgi:hypothetical protein
MLRKLRTGGLSEKRWFLFRILGILKSKETASGRLYCFNHQTITPYDAWPYTFLPQSACALSDSGAQPQ